MKLVEIDDDVPMTSTTQSHLSLPTDKQFTAPRTLSLLDNSMETILNRGDISDGEKWILYNQTLVRFLNHLRKSRPQKSNMQEQAPNIRIESSNSLHHHIPESFNNSISHHNISGFHPIKSSIASISEPSVREFFESANAKLNDVNTVTLNNDDDVNHSMISDLSPIPQPDQISQYTPPEQMSITEAPNMNVNVDRRRRQKRAANADLTRLHPEKLVVKDTAPVPRNLQPTQLFRNNKQTQSRMSFYWEPTTAK